MFEYVKANREQLEEVWDFNIANHPNDPRWIRWKARNIKEFEDGLMSTYLVLLDGKPIGEGSLLWNEQCYAIKNRIALCKEGEVCNLNGLRIIKPYEGQGHISKLFKLMEADAKSKGYKAITIGVEEEEKRNYAIYTHLSYTELVLKEFEDGAEVLYLKKDL